MNTKNALQWGIANGLVQFPTKAKDFSSRRIQACKIEPSNYGKMKALALRVEAGEYGSASITQVAEIERVGAESLRMAVLDLRRSSKQ
jgi:hypothetical protein